MRFSYEKRIENKENSIDLAISLKNISVFKNNKLEKNCSIYHRVETKISIYEILIAELFYP